MKQDISFGQIVKERRRALDLTQAELARRVACATITVRKIEADALRPSQQVAERLAMALNIPLDERAKFVRLARMALREPPEPSPLPTPPPAPEEIGGEDLSGRAIRGYELGERIGEGGFGAVYRAVQPMVEREVAIKIILPRYANHPDFIRRFEAEAQLVARLEHPYIVPLYDYWREPGVAYLVMRLLRGGSLQESIREGPLALERVATVVEQVGAALHAAHRVGVVHRDLKPANVLLDEDGNGYLADFGIAKNLSDPDLADLTQAGAMVGSPAYTSPEQIRAEPVRPQADIYCLGVLLYELLTGQRPFTGPTPIDYIQQHLNEPLPPLDAHPALDAVVRRATIKEPQERYPDVPALIAAFRQAVQAESTLAAPVAEIPYAISELDEALENPYKGLRPFGEADAEDFYGRETLVQELLGRMAEADDPAAGAKGDLARLTAIVGPSGSGKSSVVKAGLIPAMRQGGLPGSEKWFVVDLTPGAHPFEEIEEALLRIAVNPPQSLLSQLREDERGLLRAVRRVLPTDPDVELVLIVDQFEEVFTLVEDEAVRAHLLDSLVNAVLDERSRLRVVVTMRADWVGRALEYVDFGELLRQRSAFVLPLTPDELEQAIVGPAARVGLVVEPGLVATIVQDVGDQPGMLPMLQYALTELFERREGRLLTLAAYQESGGVSGALARRAEELFAGLDETGQEATRQLFLRLVTLGEGVEDTRRRVLRSELEALTDDRRPMTDDRRALRPARSDRPSRIDRVVDAYGRYRLLTFDRDPLTRGPTVEVAHEALLREWPRLRGWLDESRADVRLERLLGNAAAEWVAAERDPSYLLIGARLAQFEGWAGETDLALTGEERAYLEACIIDRQDRETKEAERQRHELEQAHALAEAQQKRAEEQAEYASRLRRRALYLTGALGFVGAFLILLILGGVGLFRVSEELAGERNVARMQARVALANKLAAQSLTLLDEQLDLGLLLGVQAYNTLDTVESQSSLLSALQYSPGLIRYMRGHSGGALSVALDPNGEIVASGSQDSTVLLWDLKTGQPIWRLAGHTSEVASVAFSPDGRILASCGREKHVQQIDDALDNTILLWDVETGEQIGEPLAGYPGYMNSVAFSPDGQILASGGCSEPPEEVKSADVDEQCAQGQVILWDVKTGQPVSKPLGLRRAAKSVAFGPDGAMLSASSCREVSTAWHCTQGEIFLWDVEAGATISTTSVHITGHGDWVTSVAFGPDGKTLASGSSDTTIHLWSVETGEPIGHPLAGHGVSVESVAFRSDGQILASGGGDHTIRLWDVESGRPLGLPITGHTGRVTSVVFGADGKTLVSGSASPDNSVRLWDPAIGQSVGSLFATYGERFVGIAFSPDGETLATGCCREGHRNSKGDCEGGLIHLWDVRSGKAIADPIVGSNTSWIGIEVFSPDGSVLAVAPPADKTVRLWDAETWQPLGEPLVGHDDMVYAIAFSPDGSVLASGDWDGTIRLWDVASGQPIGESLAGHTYCVPSLAFGPDGKMLVSASWDGTVRLWDVETRQPLGEPLTAGEMVGSMALSPDGRILATGHGGRDTNVVLWDLETHQPIGLPLAGHTEDVVWLGFSPDGRTLISSSADATIRLWDVETGRSIGGPLTGHTETAIHLAISPDGKSLASASWDGTVRLWSIDPESWKERVCQIAGRNMTQAEWEQYLPGYPYETTCPQ
jgi:WD40 repeat protein/transcriptional regulator with XRE-family HTH domain